MLRDAWSSEADHWIAWARAPGHDSYWRFHRDAFLELVPEPGRVTLDVGCGEGRLGRDLARLGHRVVGVDASPGLVKAAVSHRQAQRALLADAAVLPVATGVVDCVVAFMSLQDVDELESAIAEIGRVLEVGGRLVMAITHPLNTAGEFAPGPADARPPFVITGSWFERRLLADTCERGGLTMTFHCEHRSLQTYTEALAAAGFLIERIREVGEPDPSDNWHRIPLFLDLRAVRTDGDAQAQWR